MSIENINFDSASIAITIADTEEHTDVLKLDTLESIEELKTFLNFREIEIRNGNV